MTAREFKPGDKIGAGWVRVGDVIDITYRVVITNVSDECDIQTDDPTRPHNLHAWNATGVLVERPPEWLQPLAWDDLAECDWGNCSRPSVAMRRDDDDTWLAVCAWHVGRSPALDGAE